jgi:hypothetical protein
MTVARARELIHTSPRNCDELRDILRNVIAGLDPGAADAALVELFREIQILDNVILEECGYQLDSKEGP